MGATQRLIARGRSVPRSSLPPHVLTWAKHCVLDWLGVTLAGAREPVSRLVFEQLVRADAGSDATLLGFGTRASVSNAAWLHGTASHALDYDDTHWVMQGHPSAPVLGALFGLAERERVSGAALLSACVAGIEVECLLGSWVNPSHYALGFHATGTLGSFGAASAAAHLLELDEAQWACALGLAGTQAAGLKSGFGSMAKPLHVGRAAHAGLVAALLAAAGATAHPEIVEAAQGFAATHASELLLPERDPEGWQITGTLFKYHAACYLTHAVIEGMLELVRAHALTAAAISSLELTVDPTCLGVCDIEAPATGMQAKFSLKATAAMAVLGDATADPAAFNDARARAPELVSLMRRSQLVTQPMAATRSRVCVVLRDGTKLNVERDTGVPASDLGQQEARLRAKFSRLVPAPAALTDALCECVLTLEQHPSLDELLALVGRMAAS